MPYRQPACIAVPVAPVSAYIEALDSILPLYDAAVKAATGDRQTSNATLGELVRRNQKAHQLVDDFKSQAENFDESRLDGTYGWTDIDINTHLPDSEIKKVALRTLGTAAVNSFGFK